MFDRFLEYLSSSKINTSALVAVVGGPVCAILNAPVLMYLLLFVLIDFGTGIWKAWLIKKVASERFGDVFGRMVVYTIIYFLLHGLATVLPVIDFFQSTVMVGYMTKEAISILENLKAIQVVTGKGPDITFVINKLGIDLGKIMREVEDGFTQQARMNPYRNGVGLPLNSINPFTGPAITPFSTNNLSQQNSAGVSPIIVDEPGAESAIPTQASTNINANQGD